MTGNAIYSAIRKTSFRHLLLPLFSTAAVLMIYYLLPFSDVFTPKSVKSSNEAIELYNKGHEYVEIDIEKLYYTGLDIKEDNEVKASYYYEITNNRCTFYLLSGDLIKDKPLEIENTSVRVKIEERDGLFENMISSFSASLGWTAEGMESVTNSVIMNQSGYHLQRYVAAFLLLVAGIIYSVVLVTVNILFIVFPQVHISLIRYYASTNGNIKTALKEIKDDFENHIVIKAGDMYLSEKYFYNLGKNEVFIIALNKIVMGYEHGKLYSLFGVHISVSHTLCLRGYSNHKIVATGKSDADLHVIMDYLRENYPDIIWGHTKENTMIAKRKIKEYKKHVRDTKKDRQK